MSTLLIAFRYFSQVGINYSRMIGPGVSFSVYFITWPDRCRRLTVKILTPSFLLDFVTVSDALFGMYDVSYLTDFLCMNLGCC